MPKQTAIHRIETSAKQSEVLLEAPLSSLPEVAQPSSEVRPKSAGELASEYGVTDKTIQSWFKVVVAAYCWLDPGTLKIGNSNKTRYTPLCQELLAQYRSAMKQLSEEAWITFIHTTNADKVAAPLPCAPAALPYQPQADEMEQFTPPDRKIYKFTSTEAFTGVAKQNTETALDVAQSNSSSLTEALINQMRQEGQKLGLTLFQAKYGTAHSVLAELEQALAKKSGLAEEAHPSAVG